MVIFSAIAAEPQRHSFPSMGSGPECGAAAWAFYAPPDYENFTGLASLVSSLIITAAPIFDGLVSLAAILASRSLSDLSISADQFILSAIQNHLTEPETGRIGLIRSLNAAAL